MTAAIWSLKALRPEKQPDANAKSVRFITARLQIVKPMRSREVAGGLGSATPVQYTPPLSGWHQAGGGIEGPTPGVCPVAFRIDKGTPTRLPRWGPRRLRSGFAEDGARAVARLASDAAHAPLIQSKPHCPRIASGLTPVLETSVLETS